MSKMRETRASKGAQLKALSYSRNPLKGAKLDERKPLEAIDTAVRIVHEEAQKETNKLSERLKAESASTDRMLDTGYYCVVVFDTMKQCDAFIGALKVKRHITDLHNLFLDGRDVANAVGIEIPPAEYELPHKRLGASGMIKDMETLADAPKKGKRK